MTVETSGVGGYVINGLHGASEGETTCSRLHGIWLCRKTVLLASHWDAWGTDSMRQSPRLVIVGTFMKTLSDYV